MLFDLGGCLYIAAHEATESYARQSVAAPIPVPLPKELMHLLVPPPSLPASSFSRCPDLRILLDENIDASRNLEPLKDRKIPIISVREVGLASQRDEVVFDYATTHGLTIVTMDRDFLEYGRFNYAASDGVVVLHSPQGIESKKKAYASALGHFADVVAGEMRRTKGMLARYNAAGEYRLYACDPNTPLKPKKILESRYSNS